jgi:hypothetical protein
MLGRYAGDGGGDGVRFLIKNNIKLKFNGLIVEMK